VVKELNDRVGSVMKQQTSKSQSIVPSKPETKPSPAQAKQSLEKVNQTVARSKPSQN
jgi:hypothetical protein